MDLFANRQTRPHKDLDVSVYWDDREIIVEHMLCEGWTVLEPVGAAYLHKINNIDSQKCIKNNIWCILPDNRHYKLQEYDDDMFAVEHESSEQIELDYIEFLFNVREGGRFLYSRNHNISRELEKAVLCSNAIPYLAPEIVLLYKSTALSNSDYQHDLDMSIPLLNDESREWLRAALKIMNPAGNEWLKRIEEMQ